MISSDANNGSTVITDHSVGGTLHTVTVNGNTNHSIDTNKFGETSLKFDGTSDFLSLANSTDWAFGSGDFTLDFFIYPTSFDSVDYLYEYTTSGNYGFLVRLENGTLKISWSSNGTSWDVANLQSFQTLSLNQWQHLAIVREGSTLKSYVNGMAHSNVVNV